MALILHCIFDMKTTENVTILVVDDDPDFVEIISVILRKEGYELEAASNGNQALEMALKDPNKMVRSAALNTNAFPRLP